MNIIQLCCFPNLWSPAHDRFSIDLKLSRNVFDYTRDTLLFYDIIACAPPCDQFTKANAHHRIPDPENFILVTSHILNLCLNSGKLWFIENPPGRIEFFFPVLTKYRTLTFRSSLSNKEHVIYSNFIILDKTIHKYDRKCIGNTKIKREIWEPDLIQVIEPNIYL